MGGKKQQAQRTKGNARPSNSGRSAELLAGVSGVISFSALQERSYVPVLPSQGAEDGDDSLSSDFRLVLRKMGKRDVTTKLKALDEFKELCGDKNTIEDVKAVLPFWPRIYNRLATDHERRVREATHQALHEVVRKVGRSLAPHLRSLAPVWLTSQCDPYPPAASAAKAAFQDAFPPGKQTEAIVFCQDELLAYVQDNLFNQTAQSLSDPKFTPEEEMEAKYNRMISVCLLGYQLYLQKVPESDANKSEDVHRAILTNPKFWKYRSSKVNTIRQAWFTTVSTICEKLPSLVNEMASKISPAVLSSLDEGDPWVLPYAWEAALHVLVVIKDCWKHVNVQKAVLPKLWRILREGGQGSSSTVFPFLLPFISKLPADVTGDQKAFYSRFFTNMKEGLVSDTAKSSSSERGAIVSAYMECLQYVLTRNEESSMWRDLLLDHLFPLLEASHLEPSSQLSTTCLYSQLATFLHYIEKSDKLSPEEVVFVWDTLKDMCLRVLQAEEIAGVLDTLMRMMLCLKKCSRKRKGRVRFESDSQKEDKVVTDSVPEVKHLPQLVLVLLRLSLEKCKKTQTKIWLHFFADLLRHFITKDMLATLMETESGEEAAEKLFTEILKPWLEDGNVCVEEVVVVMFHSIQFVSPLKKAEVLKEVVKPDRPEVLLFALLQAKQTYQEEVGIRKWLRSLEVKQAFTQLAQKLCVQSLDGEKGTRDPSTQTIWEIMKFCFTLNRDREPLCGESLDSILATFRSALPDPQTTDCNPPLDSCINFLCDLSALLLGSESPCWQLPAAEDLLVCTFAFWCRPLPGRHDFRRRLRKVWSLGLRNASRALPMRMAAVVRHVLEEPLNVREVGRLVKAASEVVKSGGDKGEVLRGCVPRGRPSGGRSCLAAHLLRRKLAFLAPVPEMEVDILKVYWSLFAIGLVGEVGCGAGKWSREDEEVEDEEEEMVEEEEEEGVEDVEEGVTEEEVAEEEEHEREATIDIETALPNIIPDLMYAIAYCDAVLDQHQQDSAFRDLVRTSTILKRKCASLLSFLKPPTLRQIMKHTYHQSWAEGGLWALALRRLVSNLMDEGSCGEWNLLLDRMLPQELSGEWTEGQLHTFQVLMPRLPKQRLMCLGKTEANRLASIEEGGSSTNMAKCSLAILTQVVQLLATKHNDAEETVGDEVVATLDLLLRWQKDTDMLFEVDTCSARPETVLRVVEVINFTKAAMDHVPRMMMSHHWDFILCSAASWIQSVDRSKEGLAGNICSLAFVTAICDCAAAAGKVMATLEEDPSAVKEFPGNLLGEWKEFYCEAIYPTLLHLLIHLTGGMEETVPVSPHLEVCLESLALTLQDIPSKQLLCHTLPPKLTAEGEGRHVQLPAQVESLLSYFCPLLMSTCRPVQLVAYYLLLKVVPSVVSADEESSVVETEEDPEEGRKLPYDLEATLTHLQSVVETLLAGFQIGDVCLIEPHTHSYSLTTGYLLTWTVVLEMFKVAKAELRYQYSTYLRHSGVLNVLLASLFKLIPENISEPDTIFSSQRPSNTGKPSYREVQHLSCVVYHSAVRRLPALVRQWWNTTDKRVNSLVEKFSTKYVSPVLCAEEIGTVQMASGGGKKDAMLDNMTVKVRPSVREVVATYSIDGTNMELVIQLPNNYPLGNVVVDCRHWVGVSNSQWRNWMLQLTTFLTQQNGSILDGLAMWKRNFDKRFEGVEECYICYYVLHGSNYQLPKLQCRTCKKKFHSACLYKWFSTSNNSACPLCRNLF